MSENLTITDDKFDFEEPGGVEDNLSCVNHGDGITITCEEPWAGDTETGFGYHSSIRLDYESAQKLGEWILKAVQRGRAR